MEKFHVENLANDTDISAQELVGRLSDDTRTKVANAQYLSRKDVSLVNTTD